MEQKRREGKQDFIKGGKLDQGMGALKREGLQPPYKLWIKFVSLFFVLCVYLGVIFWASIIRRDEVLSFLTITLVGLEKP